jgi:uncharacterized protein YecT (DUF1311 family)
LFGVVFFAFLIGMVSPAVSEDRNNVARCLSIADVNERIDCLESGGAVPSTGASQTPNIRQPKPTRVGPSFDCRAANNSIERAICGDATLSEWDSRMGQQYQQVLRIRKDGDTQSVLESQRAWLLQRNRSCSGVADTAIWACLLDMTKQRVDALAKLAAIGAETAPTVQPHSPVQIAPKNQAAPVVNAPSTTSGSPSTPAIAKPNAPPIPASEGGNPLLLALFILAAAIGAVAIFNNINRRERLAEERRRLAAERQRLVGKYGEEVADRILARQVWQGMTDEQLMESWGIPADKDSEIKRAKTKETWKYGQTGRNRFSNRVFLENGIVIGWKD